MAGLTGLCLRGTHRDQVPHWSVTVVRVDAVEKVLGACDTRVAVDLPMTPPVCDSGG